ncbi:MAG: DUF4142 domain-containing protein [Saprospiraceae bacterium]
MLHHRLNKLSFLPIAIFLFIIGLVSCQEKQIPVESISSAIEINKPKSDATKESDERFLAKAAEFNFEGVLLGKLAVRRATSEEVKAMAQMMEDQHRETKSAIASLAIYKSIPIPEEPTQANHDAYDKLNQFTTIDFDIAYCDMVIQSHKDAVALCENATHDNHDADVQKLASKMLTDMRSHLAKAEELKAHLNPISELIR